MKVLLFHPFQELYGSDKIFYNIVKSIYLDHQVTVVLKGKTELEKMLFKLSPSINIIKLSFLPKAVFSYLSLKYLFQYLIENLKFIFYFSINLNRYDLILVNTLALPTIPFIASLHRIKTILYCHEYLEDNILSKLVYNSNCFFADCIITVSAVSQSNIPKSSIEKTVVIHNGIDYGSHVFKKSNYMSCLQLLYVGRIIHKKGIFNLVSNLKNVSFKNYRLSVVGEPFHTHSHLFNELATFIKSSNLSKNITLLGHHSDVQNFINNTMFVIVPSLYNDPFPTTVVESFALSTPVIATNNGGQAEIIRNNENGYLYDSSSINTFEIIFKKLSSLSISEYDSLCYKSFSYYKENLTFKAYNKRFTYTFNNFLSKLNSFKHL